MTQPRRPHSLPVFLCAALVLLLPLITTAASLRAAGQSELLVNNATLGYYNFAGNALDNTDPWFPHPVPPDPTLLNAPEPDRQALVSKAGLGALLVDNPLAGGGLGSGWGPLRTIPSSWTPTTETRSSTRSTPARWASRTSPATSASTTASTSRSTAATSSAPWNPAPSSPASETPASPSATCTPANYLQILREDHGGGTGHLIEVSGTRVTSDPNAARLLLAGAGASIATLPSFEDVFEPVPTLADLIFRPRADFDRRPRRPAAGEPHSASCDQGLLWRQPGRDQPVVHRSPSP